MLNLAYKVFSQECRVIMRHPALWLHPILFFGLIILIFGFGLGLEVAKNVQITLLWPVILWITALLSLLLAVDRLFKQEYREGSLDQFFLLPLPRFILLFAILSPMGLFIIIPLCITAGFFALILGLSVSMIGVLLLSLILALPALFLWGALGAALTLRAESSHLLISLILLPFYIPAVVFGISAVQGVMHGNPMWIADLALLAAFLLVSLALLPVAILAALKATTA